MLRSRGQQQARLKQLVNRVVWVQTQQPRCSSGRSPSLGGEKREEGGREAARGGPRRATALPLTA